MPMTIKQFKALFAQQKEKGGMSDEVNERFEKNLKAMEDQHAEIVRRHEVLQKKIKGAGDKLDGIRPDGKALDADLKVALKEGRYGDALDLITYVDALVADTLGEGDGDAVAKLGEKVAPTIARPPLKEPGKLVMPETAEGQRSVSDLMAARGAAVKWQQDEIKDIEAAAKALGERDANPALKKAFEAWKKALTAIEKARKAAVDLAAKAEAFGPKIDKQRKAVEKATKDLAKARTTLEDTRNRPEDFEERVVQRAPGAVTACEEELKEAQDALDELVEKARLAKDAADVAAREPKRLAEAAAEVVRLAAVGAYGGDEIEISEDLVRKLGDLGEKIEVDRQTLSSESIFPALERRANRHGTGRHGAQTGLDLQARRQSTGVTPDQDGNEGGLSKPVGDGSKDKRTAGGPAASVFLSPELEKEAVDKARAYVETQCTWTEVKDDKGAWKPLKRVVVTVGPPARGKGYGVKLTISESNKGDIATANQIIADYRDGRIDHGGMLSRFKAELAENPAIRPDGTGGVLIVEHATVVFDRVGGKWLNTTQVPIAAADAPIGWEIEGKQARSGTDDDVGEKIPALRA